MTVDTKKLRRHMEEWAEVWGAERALVETFGVKGAELVELLDVYERTHALREALTLKPLEIMPRVAAAQAASPRAARQARATAPTSPLRRTRRARRRPR